MPAAKITSEDKIWGAVSYLWIFSLVALASRKNNDYVRFHANQGVLLFICSIPMCFIPMLGWLINIIIGIICIIGLIKAFQGEKWPLPVGADIAQNVGEWVVKTLKL
jgi:uncharacterized membrane protein